MKMNSTQYKKKRRNEWNKCVLIQTNTNRIGFWVSMNRLPRSVISHKHSVYNWLTSNLRENVKMHRVQLLEYALYLFFTNLWLKIDFIVNFDFSTASINKQINRCSSYSELVRHTMLNDFDLVINWEKDVTYWPNTDENVNKRIQLTKCLNYSDNYPIVVSNFLCSICCFFPHKKLSQ